MNAHRQYANEIIVSLLSGSLTLCHIYVGLPEIKTSSSKKPQEKKTRKGKLASRNHNHRGSGDQQREERKTTKTQHKKKKLRKTRKGNAVNRGHRDRGDKTKEKKTTKE